MVTKAKLATTSSGESHKSSIPLEVALMRQVSGVPGVIKLLDYFEMVDCFFLVLERPANCKDLFDYISDEGRLHESVARTIFCQVLRTVCGCHDRGVVHRDIKDENILIDTQTLSSKLIDFGSGASLHDEIYTDFDGKSMLEWMHPSMQNAAQWTPVNWLTDNWVRWFIDATYWDRYMYR